MPLARNQKERTYRLASWCLRHFIFGESGALDIITKISALFPKLQSYVSFHSHHYAEKMVNLAWRVILLWQPMYRPVSRLDVKSGKDRSEKQQDGRMLASAFCLPSCDRKIPVLYQHHCTNSERKWTNFYWKVSNSRFLNNVHSKLQ